MAARFGCWCFAGGWKMLACCSVTLEDFIALTLLSEVSVGWTWLDHVGPLSVFYRPSILKDIGSMLLAAAVEHWWLGAGVGAGLGRGFLSGQSVNRSHPIVATATVDILSNSNSGTWVGSYLYQENALHLAFVVLGCFGRISSCGRATIALILHYLSSGRRSFECLGGWMSSSQM